MSGLVLGWLIGLSVVVALLAWVLGQVWGRVVRLGLDRSAGAVQAVLRGESAAMLERLNELEPDRQITGPPLVGGVTLRSWLVHYHGDPTTSATDDGVWARVVREFYTRAAQDSVVASYFGDLDEDGMAALQRHFLAMLVMLTSSGLTSRMVSRLHAGHAHVRSAAGEPITPDAYDRAVMALVGVLRDYGVPPQGLTALSKTIWPLREILTGERPGARS